MEFEYFKQTKLKEEALQIQTFRTFFVIFISTITHLAAVTLEEYLLMGTPRGHVGGYFQNMTENRANFADINLSLGYDAPTSTSGVSFGGSIWAATRLYEFTRGDFNTTKDDFIATEIYAKLKNDTTRIEAGRFYADTEWIKRYNQGARFSYSLSQFVFLDFMWVNKNAYVEYYIIRDFQNPYASSGAYFGSLHILPPNSPVKVMPYFYIAPNRFTSFGIKVNIEKPYNANTSVYADLHLLSYMGKNQTIEQNRTNGDGGFIWVEGGVKWMGVKIGGGVLTVAKRGAAGIDAFGQSSAFERREGLFFSDANTLYGVIQYTFKNQIILDAAIRNTTIGNKSIFNWEACAKLNLTEDLQVGGAFIGMSNDANIMLDDNIFASNGVSYILGRAYAQFKF